MNPLRRFLGWLAPRREAAGQPPAPPPPPAADPQIHRWINAADGSMIRAVGGYQPLPGSGGGPPDKGPGGLSAQDLAARTAKPAPSVPVVAVGDPPPEPLAGAQLYALLFAAGFGDPIAWAARLEGPMAVHRITGPRRVAAFVATIAHESNGGRVLEENLNYSADRARAVWPARFPRPEDAEAVARNPQALAEAVYMHRLGNHTPGDGWRFRGRGLIQITGRANYGRAADACGLPLLRDPDLAARPDNAALIAAWWWDDAGCNELADAGEPELWRKRVNGGLIGLHDVKRRYTDVLAAMGKGA